MEIGLCWYQQGTDNKWTYDLMGYLMVNSETMVFYMAYIIDWDAYELHPGDEKWSTTLLKKS